MKRILLYSFAIFFLVNNSTAQEILTDFNDEWNGQTILTQLHPLGDQLLGTATVPALGEGHYQTVDPATGMRSSLSDGVGEFVELDSPFDLNESKVLQRGDRRFAILNELSEGELYLIDGDDLRPIFSANAGYKVLDVVNEGEDVIVLTYYADLNLSQLLRVEISDNTTSVSQLVELSDQMRSGFFPGGEIAIGDGGIFVTFKDLFSSYLGYYNFTNQSYREINFQGAPALRRENEVGEFKAERRTLAFNNGAAYIAGSTVSGQPQQLWRIAETDLLPLPIDLRNSPNDNINFAQADLYELGDQLYVSATNVDRNDRVTIGETFFGRVAQVNGTTLQSVHNASYVGHVVTDVVEDDGAILFGSMLEDGSVTILRATNGTLEFDASIRQTVVTNYDLFKDESGLWVAYQDALARTAGFVRIDPQAATPPTIELTGINSPPLHRESYAVLDGVLYYLNVATDAIASWDPSTGTQADEVPLPNAQAALRARRLQLGRNNDESDYLIGFTVNDALPFAINKASGAVNGDLRAPAGFNGGNIFYSGTLGDGYLLTSFSEGFLYFSSANPTELTRLAMVINDAGESVTLVPNEFFAQQQLRAGRINVSDFNDQLGYGGSFELYEENGQFRASARRCAQFCTQLVTPEGVFVLNSSAAGSNFDFTVVDPTGMETDLMISGDVSLNLVGATQDAYYITSSQNELYVFDRATGQRESFAIIPNGIFINSFDGSETIGNTLFVVSSTENDSYGVYRVDRNSAQFTLLDEIPFSDINEIDNLESTDEQLFIVGTVQNRRVIYSLVDSPTARIEPLSVPLDASGSYEFNTTYRSVGNQFIYTGAGTEGTNIYRVIGAGQPELLANVPQADAGGKAYDYRVDGEDLYFVAHAADDGFMEAWRLPMGLSVSTTPGQRLGGEPPVVFPNPVAASEWLTVQAPENTNIDRVELFATDGRRLLDRASNGSSSVRLSVAELPAAQYWVRTTYSSGRFALTGVVVEN